MSKEIQKLPDLVGEEVSAVCFVRDYVELHFDGPILPCLSNPVVSMHGTGHIFPKPGSRDALCSVIGSVVLAVALEEHRALKLMTNHDREVSIPLDDAAYLRRGGVASPLILPRNRGTNYIERL